jgi:outer membrane protein insertion porin family
MAPIPPLRMAVLGLLLLALSRAAGAYPIADIRVEGLQRIAAGTVFNYLPVKVGDELQPQDSAKIIRALYQTGFFDDVVLEQDGDVLVIRVAERPAIGQIDIEGNKDLETDDLLQALKDIGLSEGRVFNRSVLDRIEQELRRQYFSRGKYAMTLESKVTPLERNRVALKIVISEGVTARIKQINLIGNESFDTDDLLDEFQLGVSTWHSALSKNDRYSKQKLSGDLETLRSYYLDRGFINFDIESTQVSITPDKKDIFITIVVNEGDVFTISDIKLAGDLVVEKETLFPMIHLRRGETFSRKVVTASAERISALLGDSGYAFANVNSIPEIDNENRQAALTFFVDPGKRVYVRRINIRGNTKTRDVVLRREMRQMEAAWFSSALVRNSRERLQRLGYFDEVNVETPAVPGSADEVDVNVAVKEKSSGIIAAGIGYSQSDGIIFNSSISQNNFLGTGKRVSFAVNTSSSNTHYQLAYTNPYYTVDGISRGFNLSYRKTDFDELNSLDYITNVGEAGMEFGLPISDTGRVGLDIAVVKTDYRAGESLIAKEFEDVYGSDFLDFRLTGSWQDDTRDSAIFPRRGAVQRLTGTVSIPGSDLVFYRVGYRHDRYVPLWGDFVLRMNADLGYGDGFGDTEILPFFENFFAGGPRSIRGFEQNTLGPRETANPNSDPIGGNLKLAGNVEMIFPTFLSGQFEKTTRFSAFLDVGNVWLTYGPEERDSVGFDIGELRYSVGLAAAWLSPLGALSVSIGYPLNEQEGDRVENFQFSFGSTF